MNNRDFISHYRARPRRYIGGGQAAAAKETLLTCPVCGAPNFSARGLAAHACRSKPRREFLSQAEIQQAHAHAQAGNAK